MKNYICAYIYVCVCIIRLKISKNSDNYKFNILTILVLKQEKVNCIL